MPAASATRPIRPSSASISRTRWPLPSPPIDGLHDIAPTVAKRWVMSAVDAPIRAAAAAASHPAWPPPTTITAKRPSIAVSKSRALLTKAKHPVKKPAAWQTFHVKQQGKCALTNHLPIQKSRKITSKISSTSTRPVSRPKEVAAERNSSAINSSCSPALPASANARSMRGYRLFKQMAMPRARYDPGFNRRKIFLGKTSQSFDELLHSGAGRCGNITTELILHSL